MSRWRALAAVRDVPDSDLRNKLVDATEALYEFARVLDVSPSPDALTQSLEELAGRVRDESNAEDDEIIELQGELAAAEERLRAVDRLEEERDELQAERDELQKRLAAAQPLIDAYADAVRFARRFVSVGERAGVPLKFCRAVPGRGKPANANARKR